MNSLLKSAFKQQIEVRQGFDFEDFIDELCLLKYGVDKYIPIRKVGDKGNDGTILSERKILACYAPKKYSKTSFQKKVLGDKREEGDFPKYVERWQSKFENWEIIVNHDVAPDQLTIIDNLDGNTSIKGIKQLVAIIENDLTSSQQRKLADFLGISEYIINDYIKDILNDLLKAPNGIPKPIKYKTPIYITDKIELNFEQNEIDTIESEIELVINDFSTIGNILHGYTDEENRTIKWRIINDFGKLAGSFKSKLDNLTDIYTKQYGNTKDDEYRRYVRTVLLYMFEQCHIGIKTTKEKE